MMKSYPQIPAHTHADILQRLRDAEHAHQVKVLLAVESGSRAWGFESPNSDFDARFIYVHPKEWYLAVNLEDKRDVIEYPIVDEIDINGWDLRKALRLFSKSNPAFIEWIQSPIVYAESGVFAQTARDLLPKVYSCEKGIYHYRSMAKTNYRGYLKADLVPLKKYFYALRPLLSVQWIERYACAPPIEFDKLLHLLAGQNQLLDDIQALLLKKRSAPEMGLSEPVPSLNAFIESELTRLEGELPDKHLPQGAMDSLNDLFQQCLSGKLAL